VQHGRDLAAPAVAKPDVHAAGPELVQLLTDRELQVLDLMAAGRPNQQIADEPVVALETVKEHVSHILAKLGTANPTQTVARGSELGLLR
jgi:LuxR family maltose regulon positive regulatory protein